MAKYQHEAVAATRPMFLATMERLKREVYTDVPPLLAKTVLRWLMQDGEYMSRTSLLFSRRIDPPAVAPPAFVLGALGRGIARDLRRLATRRAR